MKLRALPSTNAPDPDRVADQIIRHFPEAIERARVNDEEDDNVDTCLGCGHAFASAQIEIVDGHVVQLCHRCRRGDTPSHEF